MCGTHMYMPLLPASGPTTRASSGPTTPASSGPTRPGSSGPRASGASDLDALDEALVDVRRLLQRPGYRRRLLAGLPEHVELATVRLLRAVQRSDGPPAIGEVAEVLMVDPSTASRIVDRAVASGHLERQACADDGRRTRLRLTADGAALLDRATARRRELLAEVTTAWPQEDLARLVDALRLLAAGFDELEDRA